MRKRRAPSTDPIADMLAFYKEVSDRQEAVLRDHPVLERVRTALAGSKQRQAPLGALARTRKHRRRQCAGAA